MSNKESYIIRGMNHFGDDYFDMYSNSGKRVNRKTYEGFIPPEVAQGFIEACQPRTGRVQVVKEDGTVIETDRKGIYVEGFGDNVTYLGAKGFQPHDVKKYGFDALDKYRNDYIGFVTVAAISGGRRIMAQMAQREPHTSREGNVKFSVNMTYVGGHDGQTASYYDPGWGVMLICENQIPALSRSAAARSLRVRHSSNSLERLNEIVDLGGELDKQASELSESISELVKTKISRKQFELFMSKAFPKPTAKEDSEPSKAAITRWEKTNALVHDLYFNDERAANWHGTAFGVFQAVNTFQQWEAPVRGADRLTRTLENLTGTKAIENDLSTLETLRQVAYA